MMFDPQPIEALLERFTMDAAMSRAISVTEAAEIAIPVETWLGWRRCWLRTERMIGRQAPAA